MKTKIPLEIQPQENGTCTNDCIFNYAGFCVLFNESLKRFEDDHKSWMICSQCAKVAGI